jgi:hypothetical protein
MSYRTAILKNKLHNIISQMKKLNKLSQVRHHSNTSVRLMTDYLEQAMKAARKGLVTDMCTCVRLAHSFQKDIPMEISIHNKGDL